MHFTDRISFDEANQIMDVDFSNIAFETSSQVDEIYDQIAEKIKHTRRQWYFMVNYLNCQVHMAAVVNWENRGRKLNLAYSLGSVRYNATEGMRSELVRRASQDPFYANVVDSREGAVKKVAELRDKIEAKQLKVDTERRAEEAARKWAEVARNGVIPTEVFAKRVKLSDESQTMEADFSDFNFVSSRIVDGFYDYIEDRLRRTGRKWYFLVNYRNCKVQPDAWLQYAKRGKALNLELSLGSVRFDASPETASEIQSRANTESFDPNLFSSRDAAISRIAEMQSTK